jgi:DNA end-binding protein Ku
MMTLQTMRFAHEIVDAGSLNLPKAADTSKKEMDLANMLIDSMSDKFEPSKYKDDYYDKVLEIIQMKVAGVAPQAPAAKGPAPGKVVDLMEILKQSLTETKKAKGAPTPGVEEETVVAESERSGKRARKVR